MPHAQKIYNEIQGINGKFRIAQIGCFLTSFSNLLERFGKGVDPLTLNRAFRDGGVYIDVDDGIRDDLAWSSITKFNPNIKVVATGVGVPTNNNSIVKFTNLSNTWGTHFCLVADASKGLIVDSWDGQIKHWSFYKGPKTWATYVDLTPPPPAPPVPPKPVEQPQPVQSDIVNVTVASGWGISHVLKSVGYNRQQWENPAEWQRLGELNGSPQGLRLKPKQVVKVYRTPLAIVAPPPVPAPTPPAPAPVVAPVVVVPPPDPLVITVDKKAYQATAQEIDKVFIANRSVPVLDMDGLHITKQLVKGRKVDAGQIFEKDGVKYLRTKRSIDDGIWYGVPMDSVDNGQDPDTYVGPLVEDDDSAFDLDVAKEIREAIGNLSGRDKLIALFAKIQGFFLRLIELIKFKNKGDK